LSFTSTRGRHNTACQGDFEEPEKRKTPKREWDRGEENSVLSRNVSTTEKKKQRRTPTTSYKREKTKEGVLTYIHQAKGSVSVSEEVFLREVGCFQIVPLRQERRRQKITYDPTLIGQK